MTRIIAWVLALGLALFVGHKVWDRNHVVPVAPTPAPIEEVVPPVVKHPPEHHRHVPKKPVLKKAPTKAAPHKGVAAPEPTPAPAAPQPRRPANGSAALPVSCETVRWYAAHLNAARGILAAYHPTAAQRSAAMECLRGA